MIFWPNFVYLFGDPGFYPPLLNFYKASRSHLRKMDAPDRHNGQTDMFYLSVFR